MPQLPDGQQPNRGCGNAAPCAPCVVLLETDTPTRASWASRLEAAGLPCLAARDASDACTLARTQRAVLVASVDALHQGVHAFLTATRVAKPQPAVVLVASDVRAATALAWIRAGASDVFVRPFDLGELVACVKSLTHQAALHSPRTDDAPFQPISSLVGSDPRLASAFALASAAANVSSTVLIEGESGTGKSRLARAIHDASTRRDGPFVEVACGSMPEALLESELFGHVKGAFTGALADKKGRFLAAHGGTIFLDEINSAPPAMQVKLLRVLQQKKFEPVGSDETLTVDVRVIVASNEPLARLIGEGRFRQDLFYRVNILPIELPPLRHRAEDIVPLAQHFLAMKCAELGRTVLGFDESAIARLRDHDWPGNVRELENAVERATVLTRGAWIDATALPQAVRADIPPSDMSRTIRGMTVAHAEVREVRQRSAVLPLAESRSVDEREAIVAALDAHGWNRSRAADALGINRVTLYRKMRDLGLVASRRGT